MPTITNFGDVVTTGNTVLQGNLSVLNQSTFLTGNLLPNVAGSSNLGQAGTPFGSSWITSMNATSLNVTSANISSLNVSSTINIAGANVATLNVSSLNVSSENVTSLNVSSTAFIAGANITTANVSSLNVTTGANVSTLTVSSFANILSANIVTANHATLNVTTANVASLNVSTGANVSWLTVTTGSNLIQSNIVTANVGTGNISTANVSSLNVSGTAFLTSANLTTANVSSLNVTSGANVTVLTVSTLANIVSANVVTANVGTGNISTANVSSLNVSGTAFLTSANLTTANVSSLNVTSGANVTVLTVSTLANIVSANVVTANVGTGNISTANVSSLNVSGTAFLSNANVLTGNITTANVLSLNVTGDANIAQNLTIKSNLYTSNIIMSSNLSTNTGQGNVYISANLVVNGNIYSIGGSVGSGSGTSQGVIYALGANYTLGAAFVTGSAGPSIAGYHIDLSAFSPQAVQAVSSFSATSGMLKFTSAGLYQVQLVLVGDQAVSKVGIGSTSSGSFAALPTGSTGATSGYVYVYNYVAGSSPSTLVTIPLNITDVSKWYYLDTYFSTAAGSPTIMYPTAPTGGSSAGSNYGTFVQVSPFGNYLTSATGVAAGLLANCSSSSNLSGSYSSNTYRLTLTTANGWTVNGTSTAITAPTANGYFTVNQAGIYEVSLCLNAVGATPVQFQLGSLLNDTLNPGSTPASYLYTYAPMYTQDPTTTISMPVNITNISNVYFVECSFQGSSTANIVLSSTSTFLSIKPVGSYVTPATNPWSASGSLVYYSNGAVGIGTSGSPTETLTVYGNTSFVSNVTVTSDASSNTYVNAKRVPAGSLSVANYVTGSVPLTTTTNLIQNYLSNAATVSTAGVGGYGPALSFPATNNSFVNLGPYNSVHTSLASSNIFFEAWIYPNAVSGLYVNLFDTANTASEDFGIVLNNGSLYGVVSNVTGGSITNAGGANFTAGSWQHAALSWNSVTKTVYAFKNGNITAGGTLVGTARYTADQSITIGGSLIQPTTYSFNGYIYDVRVIKGCAVPTASFAGTAPSTPAVFSQTTLPSYTGLSALSGNTISLALQSQYFPGASTSPYGPCLTLPGTLGSYYSQTNSAMDTNWRTNGFCLEAWVNYASFANATNGGTNQSSPAMIAHGIAYSYYEWGFGVTNVGGVCLYLGGPSIANTAASVVTTGTWNHVMVQGNGSNIYMAVNGTFLPINATYSPAGGNNTIAPTQPSVLTVTAGTPWTIGATTTNPGPNFAIAKARLTFGTSGSPSLGNVYSSGNFTPNPNFAPVPAGATVAWSLDSQYPLPTYPSIQDVTELPQQASSYGALPTPVGGVTSNVLGPYTSSPSFDSIRFDGTGYIDYGNAASSVMTSNIWASPWTIEGWVYPTNLGGGVDHPIVSRATSSSGEFHFYAGVNTGIIGFGYNDGSGVNINKFNYGSGAAALNTWTHVAATYDGTRSNVYVGGVLSNSLPITSAAYFPTSNFIVGSFLASPTYLFSGNLADVRVSNVARYTGSSYTVPTAPFATDSSTLLLLKSLAGQVGTTLEVQGRGLNAVSLGATRSVQSYPPAPFTSNSVSLVGSYILDTTSNSSVTYGQGKYVASASSEYVNGAQYAAYNAFDKNTSGSDWASGNATYAGAGAYAGTVSTVDTLGNSYAGEWLQLQMPVSVILSSFASYNNTNYGPSLFWLLGSRDGISWSLVFKYSGASFTSQTFTLNATQAYNYYRFVAGALNTGQSTTNMYELIFNGTEEGFCISSDSKTGVGIANPQRSLEVAGDLVVSGTISGGAGMGSFRNRIINGDMRIAQRGVGPSTIGAVGYLTVDRWQSYAGGTGAVTVAQRLLTASDTPWQLGFSNSFIITVITGAAASLADHSPLIHTIEGYNTSDFKWGTPFGQPATLSFWVRSNLPAGSVLTTAIRSGGLYSYLSPVTITGSNVWQYVATTIPPPPNGSSWNTTNGAGPQLTMCYFNGSGGFSNVPNSWLAGNYVTAWNATNWVQNSGTTIEFTGIQLEKGTVATPFDVRPYATELQLCQRYWEQSYPIGTAAGTASANGFIGFSGSTDGTGAISFAWPYKVAKRIAVTPTFYTYAGASGVQVNRSGLGVTTVAPTSGSPYSDEFGFGGYAIVGAVTAWVPATIGFQFTANAEL